MWIIISLAVAIVLVLLLIFEPMIRNRVKERRDYAKVREKVYKDHTSYNFLVDEEFKVKETNFYEIEPTMKDNQPHVLGNVLHCQSGCDSGLCGTGVSCGECPVRLVLNNAFKLHRNVENVSASMHLYDSDKKVNVVDVKLDGEFKYIGYKPHILVHINKDKE